MASRLIVVLAEGEYFPCSTPLRLSVRTPDVFAEIDSTAPLSSATLLPTSPTSSLTSSIELTVLALSSSVAPLKLCKSFFMVITAPLKAVTPVL